MNSKTLCALVLASASVLSSGCSVAVLGQPVYPVCRNSYEKQISIQKEEENSLMDFQNYCESMKYVEEYEFYTNIITARF